LRIVCQAVWQIFRNWSD